LLLVRLKTREATLPKTFLAFNHGVATCVFRRTLVTNKPFRAIVASLGYFRVPDVLGGGVDLHAYNIANALARQGNEVHLVADLTDKANLESNVSVYGVDALQFPLNHPTYAHFLVSYSKANIYAARRTIALYKQLRKLGKAPDVIHTHGNLACVILRRYLRDVPIIYTVHNPTPWMCRYDNRAEHLAHVAAARLFEKPAWRSCTRAIALSQNIKTEMVRLGINANKIAVVPNGVNTTLFRRDSDSVDLLSHLKRSLGSCDRWCVFVGQLVKRKGVSILLSAIAEVEGLGCIIVGDGPEYQALRKQAESIGIIDRVVFTGPLDQPDIKALYSVCDFFVMPSTADAFPLVVLEAMACGLPVISTDIGAAREIVFDGFNGFVVAPRQIDELADKLRLLAGDTSQARLLGANAELLVHRYYTWDHVAQATALVYRGKESESLFDPIIAKKVMANDLAKTPILSGHR
jgi:glycosyltransferase involved in cell wall biosynthesis